MDWIPAGLLRLSIELFIKSLIIRVWVLVKRTILSMISLVAQVLVDGGILPAFQVAVNSFLRRDTVLLSI